VCPHPVRVEPRVAAVFELLRKPISSHAPVLQRKRGAAQHRFPVPDLLGDVLGWIRHTAVPGPPARRRTAPPRHPAVLDPVGDARRASVGRRCRATSAMQRRALGAGRRIAPGLVTAIAPPDRSPGAPLDRVCYGDRHADARLTCLGGCPVIEGLSGQRHLSVSSGSWLMGCRLGAGGSGL
jgi:hypothetical protein